MLCRYDEAFVSLSRSDRLPPKSSERTARGNRAQMLDWHRPDEVAGQDGFGYEKADGPRLFKAPGSRKRSLSSPDRVLLGHRKENLAPPEGDGNPHDRGFGEAG